MKRFIFLAWAFLSMSMNSDVIVFSRTFGGVENDLAYCVRPTADGGYIVCGQTDSYGYGTELKSDIWMIKLDERGTKEWEKTFGGQQRDIAFSVAQIGDSGYIMAGTTESFGKGFFSIWLIRCDAKGDSLWSRLMEGTMVSTANSIALTSDGGFIVAGRGKENILKLDSNGRKEWGKRYGWIFNSAEQTSDGGYIAAGDSIFQQLEWDYIPSLTIVKLDREGNLEWCNPLGNNFLGSAFDIHQTPDGGYFFSGDSIVMNLYDHSHFAIAVKLDSSGKKIWEYKGMEYSRFQSISLKSDGRCVATGNNMDEDFGMNILVVQLNKNGKEEWSRSYGNITLWEYASSIAATSDGGSIIAGQTESSGEGRYDWWILKLDENGNLEPTGTKNQGLPFQERLSLSQNYPNPFKKSTSVVVHLPEPGEVTLTIYDMMGKPVETIYHGQLPPGDTKVEWTPGGLPCGIYLCRLYFRESGMARCMVYLN